MHNEVCPVGASSTPVANCSMFRRLPANSGLERAMSEAAFRSAAGDPAGTPLRPSTPHCLSHSPSHIHQGCAQSDELTLQYTVQSDNDGSQRVLPQLPTGHLQGDQPRATRTRVMRGVITGPARWRGSNAPSGTPSLYCAVYKYNFTQDAVNPSAAQSNAESTKSACLPLPSPTLMSSTWGQGPLVIEGVPVTERHANTQDEDDEKENPFKDDDHQSFFVLTVGVFRSPVTSNSSATLFSGSGNHRKSASTPLPRPDDLLGVLHIPLRCVNITAKQQEVKLRLPVMHHSPKQKNHAGFPAQIEMEGEQELAAVLSPVASLETLEKTFLDGLNVSTTGANRCNVMLFRLSGSGGSFLSASDAILQAALAAPAPPSVASTTFQRSLHPCEVHDREARKQAYHCPNGSQVQQGAVKEETAAGSEPAHASIPNSGLLADSPAEGTCYQGSSASREKPSESASSPAASNPKDAAEQLLTPIHRQQNTADVAGPTGSAAMNHLLKDQQRQRHQRRQQELSVAAVLAASAIAAAARGERDRSSRSSTSKKPQLSQRLVPGLGLRSTQRPSSVCGVVASNRTLMEQDSCGSLTLHSHSLGGDRNLNLQEQWTSATGKTSAERTTELVGEPELSPDDSVSVRGDETHRLAATLVSRGAKSTHSVASCMLTERLTPLDGSARLNSLSDDRKSTLTTSIRRLDCLMTRAQLLLSQRLHRQSQQGAYRRAPSHESRCRERVEHQGIPSTLQEAPTKPLNSQNSISESSEASATGQSGSIQNVLTEEMEKRKPMSPQSCLAESTQLQRSSPGGPIQQEHLVGSMTDLSFTEKAIKWLNAQAARQKDLFTKKLVLLAWAQRTQMERHRRLIQAQRLVSVSENVSQKAAQQYQLLLLGWLSLRAHSGQRAFQNQHGREETSQQASGNRCRESEQQVQELIQLVEGLQKQVQSRDDWCKHLEKRSSEEQQKHTLELDALRRQIIELQEELKEKGRKGGSPPVSQGERVQQELDKISQERRQLQLLATEHAKAKAFAEEEQMRLQNELAANQERTRDLEHQLLLVDQQLVGIISQATAHSDTPTGLNQSGPSAPLGTWALKKLQGMRETLRGIDGKEPLGRTTQARRQPPLEAATFAPLQKLSQESSRHAEDVKGQIPSPAEQQQCLRALCQLRPTTPQYHRPVQIAQEAQASTPMSQIPESDMTRMQAQQQQAGSWTNGRREPSPMGYPGTKQQSRERPHANAQPEVGNVGNSTATGENQHQRFYMPQGAHVLPRGQQLKEHLDRQRTHRQQLLQQGVHHPPQQPLYSQVNPHLQASFSSKLRDPQVAVQNYAVCSFPLHLRRGASPGPVTDHHFSGSSPQCNGRITPSRMNARCLGLNVT